MQTMETCPTIVRKCTAVYDIVRKCTAVYDE